MESTKRYDLINARIQTMLTKRLRQPGFIKTDDAWHICRNQYSYGVIAFHFRCIMQKMRADGLAEVLGKGRWKIISDKFQPSVNNSAAYYQVLKDQHKPEEERPAKLVRPPAVYNNPRSPYGIADELHGNKYENA